MARRFPRKLADVLTLRPNPAKSDRGIAGHSRDGSRAAPIPIRGRCASRATSPASSSACRCFVMAWRETFAPFVSRLIDSGPSAQSRATIRKRVASPNAAKRIAASARFAAAPIESRGMAGRLSRSRAERGTSRSVSSAQPIHLRWRQKLWRAAQGGSGRNPTR